MAADDPFRPNGSAMDDPPPHALLRHYRLYFVVIYTFWSIGRSLGVSFYFSAVASVFCTLPFLLARVPITSSIVLFASFSLVFTSMSLTSFDPSHQLFLIFLQLDFFEQVRSGLLLPMLSILFATSSLFMAGDITRHLVALLGLAVAGCFSLHKFSHGAFSRPFSFSTTCLSAFLHVAHGRRLNIFVFAVSLLYSLPRLPLPVPPQPIGPDARRVLVYIVVSVSLNIGSIVVGLRARFLSIVSDAATSICNQLALFGTVVADVAFAVPASGRLSFGFHRIRLVCGFGVGCVLCFISATLVIESMQQLISPPDEEDDDSYVIGLAMASFVVNCVAAVYFGSIDLGTCDLNAAGASMTILSDLISSAAVLITSVIRIEFGVAWLDPFASLVISAMVFSITANEMTGVGRVLLQTAPSGFKITEVLRKIAPGDQMAEGRALTLGGTHVVVSMKFGRVGRERAREIVRAIRATVGDTEWTAEIPVVGV
jgi:cation diffusion facilitator family transporter